MSFDERDIPMGQDEHDHWFEEVAAYVVGGLTADEEAVLLDHAADCARCRSRIQWLQPAADLLPASVTQLSPSPQLRERIMSEVHADLEAQQIVQRRPDAAAVPAARSDRAGSGGEGFMDRLRGWFGGAIPSPALGMAAALLVVVALGGGYLLGEGGEDSAEPVVAVAKSQSAAATLTRVGDNATLNVEQLPITSRKETYQAWILRDGEPEPSTVFDFEGRPVSAAIAGSVDGADAIVVTREPAGGSQEPRGPQILTAELD